MCLFVLGPEVNDVLHLFHVRVIITPVKMPIEMCGADFRQANRFLFASEKIEESQREREPFVVRVG